MLRTTSTGVVPIRALTCAGREIRRGSTGFLVGTSVVMTPVLPGPALREAVEVGHALVVPNGESCDARFTIS